MGNPLYCDVLIILNIKPEIPTMTNFITIKLDYSVLKFNLLHQCTAALQRMNKNNLKLCSAIQNNLKLFMQFIYHFPVNVPWVHQMLRWCVHRSLISTSSLIIVVSPEGLQ